MSVQSSHNHLVRLQEEARRHRVVELPGDAHRPAPLVGVVSGGPEEDKRLRYTVYFVVFADEEEDLAPLLFMFDVAPAGR